MNAQISGSENTDASPTTRVQGENPPQNLPRMERREFEALLQRAMEILNARDLKLQLDSKRS